MVHRLAASRRFHGAVQSGHGLQLQLLVSSWVAFALTFPIAFGVAFELPLAMVLVARIGLASGAAFRRHRRVAIVVAAVLSAVLTPGTDPLSMLLMFIPLVGLYEAGIWAVWLADRHAARREVRRSRAV